MYSFGYFPGVWLFYAAVSEHSICCIFIGWIWSILHIQPMKMEQIECSETSAYNNQTPGKYPKEYIQKNYHLLTGMHHNYQVNMKALSFSLSSSPFFAFPLLEMIICCFLWILYQAMKDCTYHFQMLQDTGGSMHTVSKSRMQNTLSWG